MKLAISGKGGVGKSTLAAAIALMLAESGDTVLAIDADPDANLASALGISTEAQAAIHPIAERKALIEERTGAKVKQYGQIFKINPEVADIAATCGYKHKGVNLLVLGAVQAGGSGCACPESVLLKALVMDCVLHKNETLVMDMEAGVEHLGRGTSRGVDCMLIVVEPGQRSLDCAARVRRMAAEIGIRRVSAAANKITSAEDEAFVREGLRGLGLDLLGVIPDCESLRAADRNGIAVTDHISEEAREAIMTIISQLQERQ